MGLDPGIRRAASRIVVVLGLYQGAVPLAVRLAFDGDQRFAPALWLAAPWWWIACIAIVVAAAGLAIWLDHDTGASAEDPTLATEPAAPVAVYDALSAVVFLVGLYNGIAPFVARLLFDGDLLLAFTSRLPAPWWWIASLAVVGTAVVLLTTIDQAKQRRLAED